MTKDDFIKIIGSDLVVDYPFFGEIQQWSMKNFYIDNGVIKHNRLDLIIDNFIACACNPHKGEPTHD